MRPFLVAVPSVVASWFLAAASFAASAPGPSAGAGRGGGDGAGASAASDDGASRASSTAEHLELWVRVARGRAEVVGQGPRSHADDLGVWRHVDGRGELRLEARAEASVRWAGHASVDLVGPTRVRFEPDEDGGLRVELLELARTSIELRRGSLELTLAGGWRAQVTPGVAALEPRGSSRFAVERVVGEALCFERFGPGRAARVQLGHGGRVELAYDSSAKPSNSNREEEQARAAIWADVRWPWRERAVGPVSVQPEETHAASSADADAARASGADAACEPTPDFETVESPLELAPARVVSGKSAAPWAGIFPLAFPVDPDATPSYERAEPLEVGLTPSTAGREEALGATQSNWLGAWLAECDGEWR